MADRPAGAPYAVVLDGRTVTFTVELAAADPILTGVPAFQPTEALWDRTTETRNVLLATPA